MALVDVRLHEDEESLRVSRYLADRYIPFIVITQYQEEAQYDRVTKFAPLAYFIKPIDYTALKYTIESYFQSFVIGDQGDIVSDHRTRFLYVRKGNKYLKLRFDNLLYIRTEGNYITIHARTSKFIIQSSLRKSLAILPNEVFSQIHRNFVVNHSLIDLFDAEKRLVFIEGHRLPVGRSFKRGLKKRLSTIK